LGYMWVLASSRPLLDVLFRSELSGLCERLELLESDQFGGGGRCTLNGGESVNSPDLKSTRKKI
jgi:hypothetical protein